MKSRYAQMFYSRFSKSHDNMDLGFDTDKQAFVIEFSQPVFVIKPPSSKIIELNTDLFDLNGVKTRKDDDSIGVDFDKSHLNINMNGSINIRLIEKGTYPLESISQLYYSPDKGDCMFLAYNVSDEHAKTIIKEMIEFIVDVHKRHQRGR